MGGGECGGEGGGEGGGGEGSGDGGGGGGLGGGGDGGGEGGGGEGGGDGGGGDGGGDGGDGCEGGGLGGEKMGSVKTRHTSMAKKSFGPQQSSSSSYSGSYGGLQQRHSVCPPYFDCAAENSYAIAYVSLHAIAQSVSSLTLSSTS